MICRYCGKEVNLSSARRSIGRKYGAGTYDDCYPEGDVCTYCADYEIGADCETGAEVMELAEMCGYDWDD